MKKTLLSIATINNSLHLNYNISRNEELAVVYDQ